MSLVYHDCKICNETVHACSLKKHLKIKHELTTEQYYLKYIDCSAVSCKVCGSPTEFLSIIKGYRAFCGSSCANKFNSEKSLETKVKKYGNNNNKDKTKRTCLEKYGVENIFEDKEFMSQFITKSREEARKTFKERYGTSWRPYLDHYDNNVEKRRNTCLERYGVDAFVKIKKASNTRDRVLNGLSIQYSEKELLNEFRNIKKKKGNLTSPPNQNRIVKTFQPHIYEVENEIYKNDPIKRRKLIQNRIKYLKKSEAELTDRELLSGFKISGIHNGYSFFSPLWIKYFIEKHKVTKVLDPFGGWGHRMLGACASGVKYIYNDLNERTYKGCKSIANSLSLSGVEFYNKSAEDLPKDLDFDCIFSCPPYFKLEDYGVEQENLKSVFRSFFSTTKSKLIGLVLREDMEEFFINILGDYTDKEIVNCKRSHFNKNNGKKIEYLYTWRKM